MANNEVYFLPGSVFNPSCRLGHPSVMLSRPRSGSVSVAGNPIKAFTRLSATDPEEILNQVQDMVRDDTIGGLTGNLGLFLSLIFVLNRAGLNDDEFVRIYIFFDYAVNLLKR